MKKILFTLLSLVLAMLPGMGLSVELVTNGGFETGDFSGWTQSGNLGFTGVDNGVPHTGNFNAYFGPVGSLGFISQNLPTVPGGNYNLTFWLNNGGGTPNEYQVIWGGSLVLIDTANSAAFPYTELTSLNITAPSSSTELKFGFRQDPSFFYLDDVSVTGAAAAVPEPATMLLLGSGLIGLAGYARKRFKR